MLGVSLDGSLRAVSDPWNAGEVTVEDGRIRIVDLARVFSSPTAPIERGEDPRLLVFETRGDSDAADYCAWLVDDVDLAMSVDPDQLVRTMSRAGTRFVTGQIELDGEIVVWLDEEAVNDR